MKKKGLKILLASLLAVPLIAGLNNSDKVEANNVAHEHDLIKLERPGSGGEAVTGGDFSSSSAWQWKIARELVERHALIGLETLNIKAMQRLWGRKIGDYGFSDFVSILQYAASKAGTQIVHVDKWYPSSQLCSACGYRFNGTKDLSLRRWICPHCGAEHNRDVNAACNILTEALCIADKRQRAGRSSVKVSQC